MKSKSVTAHFYHLTKNYAGNIENLTEQDMTKLFQLLKSVPISPTNGGLSRYGKNSDRMMVFREDNVVPLPINSDYECCLFIKRRTAAYPYQKTEDGDLLELTLSQNSELVEVTYLVFDKKKGLLLMAFNRNVGGHNSLVEYLNNVIENCTQHRFRVGKNSSILDLSYILNGDPESEFAMLDDLKTMSLRISGDLQDLENVLGSGTTNKALKNIVNLGQNANSGSIKMEFIKSRKDDSWLNKTSVANIYKCLKPFFKSDKHSNKFSVTGTIDEETRIIDLISDKFSFHTQFDYDSRYIAPTKVLNILAEAFGSYRTTLINLLNL